VAFVVLVFTEQVATTNKRRLPTFNALAEHSVTNFLSFLLPTGWFV
jgi:hypothetical protein